MGAFLLDDLTSELDARHQHRVLSALRDLNSQVFVSAIEPDAVATAGLAGCKKVSRGTWRGTGSGIIPDFARADRRSGVDNRANETPGHQ